MKTLLMAVASAALLMAAPALAQDPHHPAEPAAAPVAATPAPKTDEASMHDQCKVLMGRMMDPKAQHDHGKDKTGAPTWPGGKPLTKDEMAAMHKKCAAMKAQDGAPVTPAPTPQ